MLRGTPSTSMRVLGVNIPTLKGGLGTAAGSRKAIVAHLAHNRHIIPEIIAMNKRSRNGRARGNLKRHYLYEGIVPGPESCHIDEYASAPTLGSLRAVVATAAAEEAAAAKGKTAAASSSVAAGAMDRNANVRMPPSSFTADAEADVGQQRNASADLSFAEPDAAQGSRRHEGAFRNKKRLGGRRRPSAATSTVPAINSITTTTTASPPPTSSVVSIDGVEVALPHKPVLSVPSLSEAGALTQSLSSSSSSAIASAGINNSSASATREPALLTPTIAKSILSVVESSSPLERSWLYGGGDSVMNGGVANSSFSKAGGFAATGAAAVGFHCITKASHSDTIIREVDKEGVIVSRRYICGDATAFAARQHEQQQQGQHQRQALLAAQSTTQNTNTHNDAAATEDQRHMCGSATTSTSMSATANNTNHHNHNHKDAKAPQHVETIVKAALSHIHRWAIAGGSEGAAAIQRQREALEAQRRREETGEAAKAEAHEQWRQRQNKKNDRNGRGGGGGRQQSSSTTLMMMRSMDDAAAGTGAYSPTPYAFDVKLPTALIDLIAPTAELQIMLCAAMAAVVEGRGAFVAVKDPHPLAGVDPKVQEAQPMNPVDSYIRSLSVSATLIMPSSSSSSSSSSLNSSNRNQLNNNTNNTINKNNTNNTSSSANNRQQPQHAILRVCLHHDQHLRHLFELIGESAVVDLRLLRAHVASDDYFKKLRAHYAAKTAVVVPPLATAATTVGGGPSAQPPLASLSSAAATAPPPPPPTPVVSLSIAWQQERLIKIGAVFNMVMRARNNKESMAMRRDGAATTTAPMKKRAVRTLAAWWMGAGQQQSNQHTMKNNGGGGGDDGSDDPLSSFPSLPPLDPSSSSSSKVAGHNHPTSSLYFGLCRRLRICGDKEFMFVNLCAEKHNLTPMIANAIEEEEDGKRSAVAASSSSSSASPTQIAMGAMFAAIGGIVNSNQSNGAAGESNSAADQGGGGGAAKKQKNTHNNQNRKSHPASSNSYASQTPPPPSAALLALQSSLTTVSTIECVLEKRGLTHEYVLEECLAALEERRDESIIARLKAVAAEAIVRQSSSAATHNHNATASSFINNVVVDDESLHILAEVAARRFFDRHVKSANVLPKMVLSVTAIVEASSHALQRLRLRGVGLTAEDVAAFASTLATHRQSTMGSSAASDTDGDDDPLLDGGGGGGDVNTAHLPSTARSANATNAGLTSVAAQHLLSTTATTSRMNANPANTFIASISANATTATLLADRGAAHNVGAAALLGEGGGGSSIASPPPSLSDPSTVVTSTPSAMTTAHPSVPSALLAPLPSLLADRVEASSFLPKVFTTSDGTVIAGRLTPFGEDDSLEGKRINMNTAMGRFKKNVYGKSFHQRNVDGFGASTDAEAAEFWREHYYVFHNIVTVYREGGVAAHTTAAAAAAGTGGASSSDAASSNPHLHLPPSAKQQQLLLYALRHTLLSLDADAAKAADLRIGGLIGYDYKVTLRNILPAQLPMVRFAMRRVAGATAALGCGQIRTAREVLRDKDAATREASRQTQALLMGRAPPRRPQRSGSSSSPTDGVEGKGLPLAPPASASSSSTNANANRSSSSASSSAAAPQRLSTATGFLNYFANNRFSAYTRMNSHPGLHLLKGEYRTAAAVLAPSLGDGGRDDYILEGMAKGAIGDGAGGRNNSDLTLPQAVRGGQDPRSRRLREAAKSESKVCRLVRRAMSDAGIAASTEQGCRDEVFVRRVGPRVCQLLVTEFLSFVWNEVVSQRVRRYGRRTILVGDLVRPRDPSTGNPLLFSPRKSSSDGTDGANGGAGAVVVGSRPAFATAEDILNGIYTYRDVVMPIPGAGVTLPQHDGLIRIYASTLERYGIVMNSESGTWDVFGGGGNSNAQQKASSATNASLVSTSGAATTSAGANTTTLAAPQGPNGLGLTIRGGYRYAYELPRAFSYSLSPDDAFAGALDTILTVKRNLDATARDMGVDVAAMDANSIAAAKALHGVAEEEEGGSAVGSESQLLLPPSASSSSSRRHHKKHHHVFGHHHRRGSVGSSGGANGSVMGRVHSKTAYAFATRRYRSMLPATIRRTYGLLDEQLASIPFQCEMKFQLPASAYASMLVRELTRHPRTDLKDVMALRKHLSRSDALLSGELSTKRGHDLDRADRELRNNHLSKRGRRSTEMGRALMLATLRKQILRSGKDRGHMIPSMQSMPSYGLAVDD